MKSSDIRSSFVDYFASRGHEIVPSSSLVPADDPTLLFTNAGMVQFKRVFQGLERGDYSRAVTSQKCVRAGGKHNDLEQVGHTARHHTFFEMLGNFSFGDYFKKEAIEYAWEWVTGEQYMGIDPDRLYVTVHHTDTDARHLWHRVTGIDESRVYGLGDADNFWQMGDTGPCGPCSEIYVDLRGPGHRSDSGGLTTERFEVLAEAGDLLEIWNLVFMQFDQAPDGSRTPLPAPSVDTGAGLERIAAVMQPVDSNFHTDLFTPILTRASDVIGREYDPGANGAGFRVLADHARAVAFLLADGVYPSREGRGYVLRRILRRAVRHAYLLGRTEPTLVHLARVVVEQMGEWYPELRRRGDHIESVTRAEEEGFLETVEDGLRRLEELTAGDGGVVSGAEAFKLHDTYGFPIDLTQIVAGERGWSVDLRAFETALAGQRKRSRRVEVANATVRQRGGFKRVKPRVRQKFVGYDTTRAETEIIAFRKGNGQLELVLHHNPFYAEAGGQVSDTGLVKGEGWELPVGDVVRVNGLHAVVGPYAQDFEPTPVEAIVAERRRHDIERNHTATHLVHAALRAVLGDHVRQAGSVVAPERLRFDFSHHAPVGEADLRAIEERVNEGIWLNEDIVTYELPYAEALGRGAMALFGEKYGDRVRVVEVPGISVELCGGTHVRTTGQIGLFQFTGESGVAAGVRRIEAVTGPGAYATVRQNDGRLTTAAQALKTTPEHVGRRIDGLLEDKRRLEKRVEDLLKQGGAAGGAFESRMLGDVTLWVGALPVEDRAQVGLILDAKRGQHSSRAIFVATTQGDRPAVYVAVTDDLVARGVRAGELVKEISAVSGGRGGGRPHFASASVGDPARLSQTLEALDSIVQSALGGEV